MPIENPMESLGKVVGSLSAPVEDDPRQRRLSEYLAAHSGAADPDYVQVQEVHRIIDSVSDTSLKTTTRTALKKDAGEAAKQQAEKAGPTATTPTVDEILGDIAVEASSPAMLGVVIRAYAALGFFVAGVAVFVVSSIAERGDPDTTSLLVAAGFGLLSFLTIMGYGTFKLSRK